MTDTAEQRLCRTCGSVLVKKPGPGRWPHYCSDECRTTPRYCQCGARLHGRDRKWCQACRPRPSGPGVRPCGHCGESFYAPHGGRLFCDDCRRLSNRLLYPEKYEAHKVQRRKPDHKCLDCDAQIPATHKRCEEHAVQALRKEHKVKAQCGYCGKETLKRADAIRRYASVYCDMRCRDGARAERARQRRLPIGPIQRTMIDVIHVEGRQLGPRSFTAGICKKCAAPFVATRTTSFCSEWCARRYRKSIDKKLRRARMKGAERLEKIDPITVYERDGWTCRLCRRAIKRDLDPQHPRAASIDHILPLALGGTHTYDNVQSAHRICNVRKNTGVEQLAFAC